MILQIHHMQWHVNLKVTIDYVIREYYARLQDVWAEKCCIVVVMYTTTTILWPRLSGFLRQAAKQKINVHSFEAFEQRHT